MSAPPSFDPTAMTGPPTPEQAAAMMAYLNSQRVPWYLPFMCGLFIDALFFGLICVLVAKWAWSVRQTDRFWIKIMVQYQFVISCVLSGIVMSHAYRIFIAGFGDFTANLVPGLLRSISVLFVLGRFPGVLYFLHRAWTLLQKPLWLPSVIIPLLSANLISGIICTYAWTTIPASKLTDDMIAVMGSTEVASDVILTGSLAYGLYTSKTGWESTDRVVSSLMRICLETQTPPAIIAIAFLVLNTLKGGQALGYFLFMPKVYAACVIMVVNSRIKIGEQLKGTVYTTAGAAYSGTNSKDRSRHSTSNHIRPFDIAPEPSAKPTTYETSSTALV